MGKIFWQGAYFVGSEVVLLTQWVSGFERENTSSNLGDCKLLVIPKLENSKQLSFAALSVPTLYHPDYSHKPSPGGTNSHLMLARTPADAGSPPIVALLLRHCCCLFLLAASIRLLFLSKSAVRHFFSTGQSCQTVRSYGNTTQLSHFRVFFCPRDSNSKQNAAICFQKHENASHESHGKIFLQYLYANR